MALLGTVEFMKQEYVFMETSFTKGSRQLIVASYDDLVSEEPSIDSRREIYYRGGGLLEDNYLLGILDPVRKKEYGSTQLLALIYTTINNIVRQSRLEGTYTHSLGLDRYTHGDSVIEMQGLNYRSLDINTDKIKLKATSIAKLNVKPRKLSQKLTNIVNNTARYNTSTFLDSSLESLERAGFDTTWMNEKEYVAIHSVEDWDNIVIPALMKEFRRWKTEQDFPYFLVSIDFESDGLNAFCELHPDRHTGVYFSISFADNQSFGVFLKMENFDNVDLEGMAERLTYLTQNDPLPKHESDRTIILEHNGDRLELKRSELTIIAHNMMIDRRFGLTVGADIWFDLCTLQLSFNLDPYMTQGINGLKHIVTKFFGIEYAELGDICGNKNKGMFKYLTDKRVIMMYGCADTDWHRLAAKQLIRITEEAKEYYGVDHTEQHMDLDSIYMNHKAECDYNGMRVDLPAFTEEYNDKTRILNLYYSFMAQYVGRVKAYKDYEKLVINAERYNIQLDGINSYSIATAPSYRVDKWTGKELLNVLFNVLDYPTLCWTTQNKKAKLQGRKFKQKPAVNTEALRYYMKIGATVDAERIAQAFESQTSLEDLKWFSMYLKDDYVDPVTGNVLISKDKFNSYRLPFFYVLNLISPLVKSITAELKPIVEGGSEYKFSHCNMTSAVTRRDLNPTQTISKYSKFKYIPYDDDYYYCAVDQSAVEIRILYGLSKNKELIEPLNNPEKDTHTETAALMYQKPAHTITKDIRKGVKPLAFGIPYGKEVFSMCKDLHGDNSPEHMAETAYLFNLYTTKLKSVMDVLNGVRDKMDEPVNPPQSLKDYLEMDPEKKYGRMVNAFGYCQHSEIREEEWFRQAIRRKAGNFIIQGFAANLLRKIYVRMLQEFWRRGWIQDKRVRIHLTVHDEIDMSYHKSLNPVEVMSVLYKALTVKMKGFPTFFVGINFGNSWGEAKQDEAELPVLLVEELHQQFLAGKFDNYDFGNHLTFFKNKREDFYIRRVKKELLTINENKNVWDISKLNDVFTNYTVRALLPDVVGKPLFKLDKGNDDADLMLASYLPRFIAQHILPEDNRKHYMIFDGKPLEITEDFLIHNYDSLEEMFKGTYSVDSSVQLEELSLDHEDDLTMEDSLEFDAENMFGDDIGFDFDEDPVTESADMGDIENLSSGFLTVYTNFKVLEDEFVEYGSINDRVNAEVEAARGKVQQFKNFKVSNGKIILPIISSKVVTDIRKMCVGNTSNKPNTLHLFIKHNGSLVNMNKYEEEFLHKIDDYLETKTRKTGVV